MNSLAKCGIWALVWLMFAGCGNDPECDAPSGGPDGSPLKISCEDDVEHQCENVYSYIKVCADGDARFSCTLASEDAFMNACGASPLDADDYEAIFTWACGDVIYVYCGEYYPCTGAGYPAWLCRP